MTFGKALKPYLNSKYCGDQCAVWRDEDRVTFCMIDGLGHGQEAEIAARAALAFVADNRTLPLDRLFIMCDQALVETRGVAMGIGVFFPKKRTLDYCCVGNTRACIFGMDDTYLGSQDGIVGNGLDQPPLVETHPLMRNQTLGFWTDGLPETLAIRALLKSYRGDLDDLCARLIRDHAQNDDAGLMLYKCS